MSDAKLDRHWVVRESSRKPGVQYYFNTATGETSWDRPKLVKRGSGDGVESSSDKKRNKKDGDSASGPHVRVLHILCKHCDSRNPSSWRSEQITLTKEAAQQEIEAIATELAKAADFEAAFRDKATSRSDCRSAERGGDLGSFGHGKMQKPFEEAAFALEVGQMSGVVDTNSGLHLLLRLR